MKVCNNDEQETIDWMHDHKSYTLEELLELYGGADLGDLDEDSLKSLQYLSLKDQT